MRFLHASVPPEWLEALALVQEIVPEALLGGRALRDVAFGHPETVKDLDIFIPAAEGLDKALEFFLGLRFWTYNGGFRNGAGYRAGMRGEVSCIQSFTAPDLPTIQIIQLSIPEWSERAVAARMDFSSCQAVTDGATIYPSPACVRDILSKPQRLTLERCEDPQQAERSLRRAERFRERFGPDVLIDTSITDQFITI